MSGPTEAPVQEVQWHRVHRITPLLNAWRVAAGLFAIAAWSAGDDLAQLPLPVAQKALIVVGVIVAGTVIGLIYNTIAWRRTRYGIGEDSIFMHSGVLWRQQRHVRLDRLQTVDVTQPLLARLFGFSSLKIESAGGAESNLTLSYLTDDEAQRVRNEILARAAGVRSARLPVPEPAASAGATGTAGRRVSADAAAAAAPETPLLELTTGRLMASLVRSAGVVLSIVGLVGMVAAIVITQTFVWAAGALPGALGAVGYLWSRFAGEFSYRIGISADGLRLRHGLLEAKTRTVPPGRIQALSLSQTPLWRGKDWWRIRMTVAGYGGESEDAVTVLYPVATTAEVEQILPLVLPDLGTERPLDVLHAALSGVGEGEGFLTSPPRAKVLDRLTWRHNGMRITDTAVLLRSGRWWRYLAIVPHERTQSFALTQGPWERRLRLAGISFHTTPGPVTATAAHLDAALARELVIELAGRARAARRAAGPEQWMRPREVAAGIAAEAADTAGEAERLRRQYGGVLPTPRS